MKAIYKIIKKIIFAFAVLYGFNIIMESLKLFIPINLYTTTLVALLGFPGLFVLVGLLII
jgi:pro-sigmaK processing inhibitor BofA